LEVQKQNYEFLCRLDTFCASECLCAKLVVKGFCEVFPGYFRPAKSLLSFVDAVSVTS